MVATTLLGGSIGKQLIGIGEHTQTPYFHIQSWILLNQWVGVRIIRPEISMMAFDHFPRQWNAVQRFQQQWCIGVVKYIGHLKAAISVKKSYDTMSINNFFCESRRRQTYGEEKRVLHLVFPWLHIYSSFDPYYFYTLQSESKEILNNETKCPQIECVIVKRLSVSNE